MIDHNNVREQHARRSGVSSKSSDADEQLRELYASALKGGRIIRLRLQSMSEEKSSKLVVKMLRMVDREIQTLTELEKEVGRSNQARCASVLGRYRARLGDPAIQDAVELVLKLTDKASESTVGDATVVQAINITSGRGKSNVFERRCHAAFEKIGIGRKNSFKKERF